MHNQKYILTNKKVFLPAGRQVGFATLGVALSGK